MRALKTTSLRALACALLLILATTAQAGMPTRPIDRPDGSPIPDPVMAGDPDEPPSLVVVPFTNWVLLVRLHGIHLAPRASGSIRPNRAAQLHLRSRNAR
jgi:hypothetical protein